MPSSTGNLRAFPKVLQNGPGNIPDADEVMANFDKANDLFYICTEAQLSGLTPNTTTIYYVTDADDTICLRIYRNGSWFAIPIAVIG